MTSTGEIRLLLVGLGQLGRRFAKMIHDKGPDLRYRYGVDLRLVGAADSRGSAVNVNGLDGAALAAIKASGGGASDLPHDGRPGVTGLQLIEAVSADVLLEASPVHLNCGAQPGLTHVRSALEKGMHVITPNKGPIVLAYRELRRLASEHGVELRFDGTVAGGLPALSLGLRDLRGARIEAIESVPNLTTGFVLDELARGASWDDAEHHARGEGVLESDPGWDLDGWDAAAKLVILANAVLDLDVRLADIEWQGIRTLDVDWVRSEHEAGRLVRLVASATRTQAGRYEFRSIPVALDPTHPLGHLGSKQMGIVYRTDLYGTMTAIIDEPTPLPSAATMLRDLLDIYVRA